MGAICPKCELKFEDIELDRIRGPRGFRYVTGRENVKERPGLVDAVDSEYDGTQYRGSTMVWEYTCPNEDCGHRFHKVQGGQHDNMDAPLWIDDLTAARDKILADARQHYDMRMARRRR